MKKDFQKWHNKKARTQGAAALSFLFFLCLAAESGRSHLDLNPSKPLMKSQ